MFIILSFALNRIFVNYISDSNMFKDIYIGILILFEFTLGTIEYIKNQT